MEEIGIMYKDLILSDRMVFLLISEYFLRILDDLDSWKCLYITISVTINSYRELSSWDHLLDDPVDPLRLR